MTSPSIGGRSEGTNAKPFWSCSAIIRSATASPCTCQYCFGLTVISNTPSSAMYLRKVLKTAWVRSFAQMSENRKRVNQVKRTAKGLEVIERSWSWKIGRAMTLPVTLLRNRFHKFHAD